MAKKIADKGVIKTDAVARFAVTTDGSKLNIMIDDTARRNGKLMNDLHIVLVSCVLHFFENNANADPLARLCTAFATDKRVESFVKWLRFHAPVVHSKKEEGKKITHSFKKDKARWDEMFGEYNKNKKAYQSGMEGYPFWDFDPPKDFKGFDFMSALMSLIERGEEIEGDETKVAHPKTKLAGLAQARAFAKSLKV